MCAPGGRGGRPASRSIEQVKKGRSSIRRKTLFVRLALLLLWMGLIYWSSASPHFQAVQVHQIPLAAQPGQSGPPVLQPLLEPALIANPDLFHLMQLFVRKSAHLVAFGVLAILARWTMAAIWPRLSPVRLSAAALLFAIIYAMTDEWHQTFRPGRDGRVVDVLIDSVGALVGLGLVHRRQ